MPGGAARSLTPGVLRLLHGVGRLAAKLRRELGHSLKKRIWGLAPFILLVLAFELLPLLLVVVNGFRNSEGTGFSLAQYQIALTNPYYLQSIGNSLLISLLSSVFGLAVAMVGSYSLTRIAPRIRDFVLMYSGMTANFAGVPLAFAFIIMLGQNGYINIILRHLDLHWLEGFNIYTWKGLVLIYTYFQIPLGILVLYPAFAGIRREWMECASTLGASGAQFWIHIGVPVLSRSILGTFSLLFANAMGAYATAMALTAGNYNLLPIRIGDLISGYMFLNPYLASALSVLLGAVLVCAVVANDLLARQQRGVSHERG